MLSICLRLEHDTHSVQFHGGRHFPSLELKRNVENRKLF